LSKQKVQVIWFKRDLRIADNECLVRAAANGSVLPILVVEPQYWSLCDTSWRQFKLLQKAANSLQDQLSEIGGELRIWTGDAIDALKSIRASIGDFDLWAHQETGNFWTFERDVRVREWCAAHTISFSEPLQYGVFRGSSLDRDRWAQDWNALMKQPILDIPQEVQWAGAVPDSFLKTMPSARSLNLAPDEIIGLQPGGREAALATLKSFLYERGRDYRTDMSSPRLGAKGCSRLSVHLVTGSISMRECFEATTQRLSELSSEDSADAKAWRASLKAFIGRLHWHCHFMQKFETEPEMEFRPVARSYEGMRPAASEEWHRAFAKGQTGFPFVDACMRSLIATGWINFRMRAMLMSFACYDLFMPWQEAGEILGRLFTDYEPGIHWTQSQMQSGETGINTLRVYSPIKQGRDHDPDGKFIKQWVNELRHLDGDALHEPWKHGGAAGYPGPLVDHSSATKAARDAIWAIRKTPEAKAEAADVLLRHGSRRRPKTRRNAPSGKIKA